MHCAVVAASRHRNYQQGVPNKDQLKREQDIQTARDLLFMLSSQHGGNLVIASVGCDVGMGLVMRDVCSLSNVKHVEFMARSNRTLSLDEYATMHLARNVSLLAMGHEFHLFLSTGRSSFMEDLVVQVRASGKHFSLYNEDNEVTESNIYAVK